MFGDCHGKKLIFVIPRLGHVRYTMHALRITGKVVKFGQRSLPGE